MSESKSCLNCGKEFEFNTSGHKKGTERKYCSRKCYWEYIANTHSNYTCPQCGKPFRRLGTKVAKYCSRECHDKAQENKVMKTCPVCHKDFLVKRAYINRYKVCSRKCRLAKTIYHQCARCGKIFTVRKGRSKYCSEECYRPPVISTCKTCGKQFRRQPSQASLFCSVSCYRRYTGESSLEKITRHILDSIGLKYEQESKIGRYSVDFFIPIVNLVIECDGAYWHRNKKRDARKNHYLKSRGYKLIRLAEDEIINGSALKLINQHILNQNLMFTE